MKAIFTYVNDRLLSSFLLVINIKCVQPHTEKHFPGLTRLLATR